LKSEKDLKKLKVREYFKMSIDAHARIYKFCCTPTVFIPHKFVGVLEWRSIEDH